MHLQRSRVSAAAKSNEVNDEYTELSPLRIPKAIELSMNTNKLGMLPLLLIFYALSDELGFIPIPIQAS